MQKVLNGQKPFYPIQYRNMEQKATNDLLNGKDKDQHFSVQLGYTNR